MIDAVSLAANFVAVEARITQACLRASRARNSVQLIAVSKLHPPALIRLAWALGQRDFGENYAQELRDKHTELAECVGLRWHAIGPVQPKNAKYVARAAHLFHALDRIEVAEELSKRRQGQPPLRCLVEINVSGETTKAGIAPDGLSAFLTEIRELSGIQAVGLTTMPPPADEAERSRPHFQALRQLAVANDLSELSMGTSGDFEVAIEEGATLVRVGTTLFGHRELQGP